MTRVSDLSRIETPPLSSVLPVSDGLLTKKATLADIKDAILPPATGSILGGIKVGNGLSITDTGVLSVADFQAYTLPVATENQLGGVRVGTGLSMDNVGRLNLDYELPTATSNVLGGIKIGDGLLSNNGVVSVVPPDTSQLNDAGLTVGANDEIKLYVDVQTPTLQEDYRGLLNFSVRDTSVTGNYAKVRIAKSQIAQLLGGDNVPAVYPIGENKKINLGLPTYEWGKVYADEFVGVLNGNSLTATTALNATNATTATNANSLLVVDTYRTAATTASANTIAARDSSGDIYATVFRGVSTSAQYADLAEKYESDGDYDEGTVVVFGGEKEITLTNIAADTRVAGVISAYPAYIMNSSSTGQLVALRGRVPVKVKGLVKKGDLLITSDLQGYAEVISQNSSPNAVFAKSLDNKDDTAPGMIIAVIL